MITLIAFAANSILCRYALEDKLIDPISFTLIHLFTGAITLGLILFFSKRHAVSFRDFQINHHGRGALYLLIYAICFSLAYISLDTATGALLLFASVQLCILGLSRLQGYRFSQREILGCILAGSGFLVLTLPHFTTPSLSGLVLMIIAGLSWGLYTLEGKKSAHTVADTTINFLLASILCIPLALLAMVSLPLTYFFLIKALLPLLARAHLPQALGMHFSAPYCLTHAHTSSQCSATCTGDCGFWGYFISE